MFIIDPFSIAVQGLYPTSTPLNTAVQGWIVEILEEIVEVPSIGGGATGRPARPRRINDYREEHHKIDRKQEPEKQKLKKITVTCVKDDQIITKTKYYKNVNVTAKDIDISISGTTKNPKVHIKLIK